MGISEIPLLVVRKCYIFMMVDWDWWKSTSTWYGFILFGYGNVILVPICCQTSLQFHGNDDLTRHATWPLAFVTGALRSCLHGGCRSWTWISTFESHYLHIAFKVVFFSLSRYLSSVFKYIFLSVHYIQAESILVFGVFLFFQQYLH